MSQSSAMPSPNPTTNAAGPVLVLYSRRGCCLCEGLEEKLLALEPPLPLVVIDVDQDPVLQARFGLEVPVLALSADGAGSSAQPLPRVPPRLQGQALWVWLQKHGFPAGNA